MKKLELDPEMLRVETFAPGAAADAQPGTVAAHGGPAPVFANTDLDLLTCAGSCLEEHAGIQALTYDGGSTCVYSCPGKCFNTNMLSTQCC